MLLIIGKTIHHELIDIKENDFCSDHYSDEIAATVETNVIVKIFISISNWLALENLNDLLSEQIII